MNKPASIYIWYAMVLLSLGAMILIGGITRLTDSGLSMVDWQFFLDIIPPLTESQWTHKFELYKSYSEYQVYHQHFELKDFKFIYFWEYFHRLFARFLGLIFFVPFLYFLLKKRFFKKEKSFLFFALILGVFQAFIGWYMVKSGLQQKPDISHLRLSLHLSVAFLITLTMVKALLLRVFHFFPQKRKRSLFINCIFVLTFFQISIGAFVSGMKAGYSFNTWPKMGSQWIPDNLFYLKPFLINFVNNPFAVQFLHRHLGVLIVFLIIGYAFFVFITNKHFFRIWMITTIIAIFQMFFGIFTLIWKVPILMASLHQILAIFLLSSLLLSSHIFKFKK